MREKTKKALKLLPAVLGVLVLCVLFWSAAVLLYGRGDLPGRLPEQTPAAEYTGTSAAEAASAFGAELPLSSSSGIRTVRVFGEERDGISLCRVSVEYADGTRLEAVRPAGAAYVISESGYTVNMEKKITVRGADGVLCEGEKGAVLYFSDTEVSYAFFAENAAALEDAASRLR